MEPIANTTMNEGQTLKKSWERAQCRINGFWTAFKKDYLSLLHHRAKWRTTKEDLKVDDIVVMVDDCVARNQWKLGRITVVNPSGNHARTIEVKRSDGKTFIRDRTSLVKLEIEENK